MVILMVIAFQMITTFTWQPHGSQFTVIYDVPISSTKFKVNRPPVLDFAKTLDQIGVCDSGYDIGVKYILASLMTSPYLTVVDWTRVS